MNIRNFNETLTITMSLILNNLRPQSNTNFSTYAIDKASLSPSSEFVTEESRAIIYLYCGVKSSDSEFTLLSPCYISALSADVYIREHDCV